MIRVTGASVEVLVRACEAVGDLISRVGPDQWNAPTPGSDWNVRDVVNHVVEGNQVFVAVVEGGPMPERGADHLGDDPAGAYRASAAVLRDAFVRPGVLERSYPGPFGKGTGAEILQIRLADLLTHGWDLAQATANNAHHDSPTRNRPTTAPRRSNSLQLSPDAKSPQGNNG